MLIIWYLFTVIYSLYNGYKQQGIDRQWEAEKKMLSQLEIVHSKMKLCFLKNIW